MSFLCVNQIDNERIFPNNTTVYENVSLTILCYGKNVKWDKNNTFHNVLITNNNELTIRNTEGTNNGKYICTGEYDNGYLFIAMGYLTVIGK